LRCYAFDFPNGVEALSGQSAFHDVLTRNYENQLALEAAIMKLVLSAEQRGTTEAGENACGALQTIGENAGNTRQGLARLRTASPD